MLLAICTTVINKISREDSAGWERLAADFKNQELDQARLAAEINAGHAFTTQHRGRRAGKNFKAAGYIALDYDNVRNQDEVQAIMSHSLIKNYHSIFYHTPSAKTDNPRFRIIFELEHPIYDGEVYGSYVQALIWRLGAVADQSCKDPCRLFFGARGSQPKTTGRVLPLPVLAQIAQEWRAGQKEQELKARAESRNGNGHTKGKEKYLEKVLENQINRLASAPKGERHDITLKVAKVLGGYCAGEGLDENRVISSLMNAIGGSDVDYKERKSAIESGLREGKSQPLYIPELVAPATTPRTFKNGVDERGEYWQEVPPPDFNDAPPPESEKPKTKKKIELIRADELDKLPPLTYLVEGELLLRGVTGLYGPAGAGKSFYSLDLALKTAQESPVIYIAAEGVYGYNQRVQAWCEHNQVGRGWLYFWPASVNFMSATEVTGFCENIKQVLSEPPKLIVIDTLNKCMAGYGGEENSNTDMAQFLVNCDQVRDEFECSVLVIHHTGKNGTYRGASAFIGGVDIAIELDTDEDLIKVSCAKAKDSKEFPAKYLRRIEVKDSCVLISANKTDQITIGGKPSEKMLDILERLNYGVFTESGAKVRQLQETLEIHSQNRSSNSTLYYNLSMLKKRGYVTQGPKGDPYFITFEGKEALRAYRPLVVQD